MNWAIQLSEHWKKRGDIVQAFGLILYTDRHVHIKKVLTDNDYWAALDEISGPRWPVFSIKPRQGTIGFPDLPPGHIGMMVPVWKEPRENKPLLQTFGLSSTEDLPKLVVYCSGPNNEVLSHAISLKDGSVEEAYGSLKAALEAATRAVEDIRPENSTNGEGIHAALSITITSHKQWELIKSGFNLFKLLKDIKP
jgi:hypothetical protein